MQSTDFPLNRAIIGCFLFQFDFGFKEEMTPCALGFFQFSILCRYCLICLTDNSCDFGVCQKVWMRFMDCFFRSFIATFYSPSSIWTERVYLSSCFVICFILLNLHTITYPWSHVAMHLQLICSIFAKFIIYRDEHTHTRMHEQTLLYAVCDSTFEMNARNGCSS